MLECRACLWRCLRAICRDEPSKPLIRLSRPSKRAYSSRDVQSSSPIVPRERSRPVRKTTKPNSIISAARVQAGSESEPSTGITNTQLKRLKLEVPWLGADRVKVLRRTKELLKDGRQPEALELVKLSSKDVACTVAWNAILDDLMARGKVNEAFRVYNDMKKRAQIPDSYTYSTLFNGLATNGNVAGVGRKAVQLWESLNKPTSKVKPSILLTNAALKACASVGQIDALWSIAGAIPDTGSEAANSITYTTILNAMRFSVEVQPGKKASETQEEASNTAITQGRQIWADVISRWTTMKLTLDEDLVCAMGRLLLAGQKPQDWDDIFQLCLQSMNIPRASPPLSIRDRSFNPNKVDELPAPFMQSDRTMQKSTADVSSTTGEELRVIDLPKKGVWVKATNQTLTLLMEACQKMFLSKAAMQYWKTLTDGAGMGYAVKPDSASFHAYLRMLRQSKSSAEALRFVRDEMKTEKGAPKTFRIAISTCVRNQLSPNAMREATELMDVMLGRLGYIDIKAGTMYMKLALSSPHTQDTLVALSYMTPKSIKLWDNLKSTSQKELDDLAELGKQVVSGFDRIMNAEVYTKESGGFEEYQKRKAAWTYAVQRSLNGGKRVAPHLTDEERALVERQKALRRFDRMKQRNHTRVMRTGSHAVKSGANGRGLPKLEMDLH